jgi:hypothetical protein
MNNPNLNSLKTLYLELEPSDRLSFLSWLWQIDKHKMDYASMPDTLQRFYNPKEIRPK